jgi:hypothetical protein
MAFHMGQASLIRWQTSHETLCPIFLTTYMACYIPFHADVAARAKRLIKAINERRGFRPEFLY